MKKYKVAMLGVAIIAAAIGAVTLLNRKAANKGPAIATAAIVMELAPSETYLVRLADLKQTVPLSGSLRPLHQVTLKSEVAARLSEVLVREGQPVKKGDVIARFDIDDLTAHLDERKGNLQSAQAQLLLAEKNRARKMALRGNGYTSEVSADEAESSYQQALSAVQAMQAQLDIAKEALKNATVYAPMTGFVNERPVNPGEKMGMDGKLMTIVDLREMEIEAARAGIE